MSTGIVLGIVGVIFAGGLITYFFERTMNNKNKEQQRENGAVIPSEGGIWKISTYSSIIAAVITLIFAVVLAFMDGKGLEGTLLFLSLGGFFILMAVFSYFYDKRNRIKYNDKAISK